ncbi:hypothetical protein V8V73_17345 [Priestia megaterium]|uniref:GTP pyrophosphokinase n=1 Tax=Priestia megaterium TaxID=1404 RepID=UPI00300BF82B
MSKPLLETNETNLDVADLTKIYKQNHYKYKALEEEVKHTLNQRLKEEDIKIHSVLSRIKELESFLGKADRKQTDTPFEDINDIVGTRVVCLFLSDIEKISACIKDCFEIVDEDNKVHGDNISSFGYMSVHFIATLKDEYSGPRYDFIKDIKFEIQVRTISMDAWANISHYLDYKSENDVPAELKRDFHALSGLFYVADSHFEMFVQASKHSQLIKEEEVKNMLSNAENHIDNDILNFDSLRSYLKQKFTDRELTADIKNISALLEELLNNGYDTLAKLDKAINKSNEAFLLYEKKYTPGKDGDGRFTAVGAVRMSLCLVDKEYKRISRKGKVISRTRRHDDPEIQDMIDK